MQRPEPTPVDASPTTPPVRRAWVRMIGAALAALALVGGVGSGLGVGFWRGRCARSTDAFEIQMCGGVVIGVVLVGVLIGLALTAVVGALLRLRWWFVPVTGALALAVVMGSQWWGYAGSIALACLAPFVGAAVAPPRGAGRGALLGTVGVGILVALVAGAAALLTR